MPHVGFAAHHKGQSEAMSDNLDSQFQSVNDLTDPAVIVMVVEALRAYLFAVASEPKLTIFAGVQDVIRGLKVGKGPCRNGITNRVLKHLPQRLCPSS